MDEYINRNQILDEINGEERPDGNGVYDYYSRIFDIIDTAPSADVVPVIHGEWCGTVCSACGTSVSFYYDCNYCPICGAKMDGDDNG